MKVVLDTNVLISALFWSGPPNEILKCAEDGDIALAASIPMLEELSGVLSREKFKPLLERAGVSVESIQERVATLVALYPHNAKISIISEDPSDDMFLACAFAAQAPFIVSGDRHLLRLKEWQGIRIVTPKQFLQKMRRAQP